MPLLPYFSWINSVRFTALLSKYWFIAFTLLPTISLADAPSNTSLSLKEAIALTLSSNPELKALPFKQQALEGEKHQISLRPPLHLGVEFENFAGSGKSQGIDALESTITLGSVLELGNKRGLRLNAIDSKMAAAQMQRQADTLDILGGLTVLFIQTLKTQESILITQEEQALARKSVAIVKRKAREGAAAEIDIQRANVALARTNIQLDALISQLHQQFKQLSQFWGEPTAHYKRLIGELYAEPEIIEFETLLKHVRQSPHAQQLALERRIKDTQYQLALAQGRSDIGWNVGFKHFNETGDTALVAGISTSLNQRQRTQGHITIASAEQQRHSKAQKHALQTLETQLFVAHSQRNHHAKAMRIISETIIPALSETLSLSQQAYENGRYSYFDWSMAQQGLFEAKHCLLEHASTLRISQALIEQLTGEPFAPTLNTPI